MIIFQSLQDIFLESIIDLDTLTEDERTALFCSCYGVQVAHLPAPLQEAFKSGIKKYMDRHDTIRFFYERG